jgi:hypothetical protein
LKSTIYSHEKNNSGNYLQLSKLTARLSDLQSLNEKLRIENSQLLRRLETINETVSHPDVSITENMTTMELTPTKSISLDSDGNQMAKGIVHDWARKNQELKNQLKLIQDELRNEVSFSVADNSFSFLPRDLNADTDSKQRLETEHQALLDIFSQVKSDFQKAAMTSPSMNKQ